MKASDFDKRFDEGEADMTTVRAQGERSKLQLSLVAMWA